MQHKFEADDGGITCRHCTFPAENQRHNADFTITVRRGKRTIRTEHYMVPNGVGTLEIRVKGRVVATILPDGMVVYPLDTQSTIVGGNA